MTRKPFASFITAAALLTFSSLLKFYITSSLMVDENPVRDRLFMILITGMFFLAVILGSYAYWRIVCRKRGFDLTPQQTKRLAQVVILIASFMAPMLSNDFSIYLAHGNLLTKGILSYTDGTKLQSSDFYQYVSFHWKECPNFYGPPLLVLLSLAAFIGGKSIAWSLIVFKMFNTVILFLYIHITAKYCEEKPGGKYNQLALATLAPVLWIQAAGQAHVDGIIMMLAMGSIYFIQQNKNLVSSALIGIIVACKAMYAAIFLPFYFAAIYFRYRSEFKTFINLSLKSLSIITLVFAGSYTFFWEGPSTIIAPIRYHSHKAPANSFVSALTQLAVESGSAPGFLLNNESVTMSAEKHKPGFFMRHGKNKITEEEKRIEGIRKSSEEMLTPVFNLFGLLLALFNFVSLAGVKRMEDVFHIFGKILIITVCFFSPIFHPWYFLLPLPFLIDTDKRTWIVWLAVVPALASLHEIKFAMPREYIFYSYAEALVFPMLASFFLFFRQHFIMEPLELLKPVFSKAESN